MAAPQNIDPFRAEIINAILNRSSPAACESQRKEIRSFR